MATDPTTAVIYRDSGPTQVAATEPNEDWQEQILNIEGTAIASVYTEFPQTVYYRVLTDMEGNPHTVAASGQLVSGVALDTSAWAALGYYFQITLAAQEVEVPNVPTAMGEDSLGQLDERKMSLRWQDDRERWSKERLIDLGTGGDMFPTVRLFRLGLYRTRQWELVCATSILQCVAAIEEDAEVLR